MAAPSTALAGAWGSHRVIEIVETLSDEHVRSVANSPVPPVDEQFVRRVQMGDLDAFSELVRRYQSKVYRYVLKTIGCPEDAQDVTQDTFVRAFNQIDSWRPKALFRTWLFRIATNGAIDLMRKRRVWRQVPIDEVVETSDPDFDVEERLDSQARFARMVGALYKLPPIFRQTLLLRELEGMSYAAIAEILNVTEGTVKSRIARARRMLLKQVKMEENRKGDDDGSQ